jgi:hypothetical protein
MRGYMESMHQWHVTVYSHSILSLYESINFQVYKQNYCRNQCLY